MNSLFFFSQAREPKDKEAYDTSTMNAYTITIHAPLYKWYEVKTLSYWTYQIIRTLPNGRTEDIFGRGKTEAGCRAAAERRAKKLHL